jgi:tRNA threonylcarbamoyladenosine biosynthesis protein TsaE
LRSNARKLELNVQQLANWGRALGEELSSPLFIQLAGDLGAGKTTLAAAICAGYGVSATVTSPTFSLINRYDGARGPVYHVDLYRLNNPREVAQLGLLELLREDAILLLEWPERAEGVLPAADLCIHLEHDARNPLVRSIQVNM